MIENHKLRKLLFKVFSILYLLAKCVYKPISFVIRPIFKLHPRLEIFYGSVTNAFVELIRPPQIGPGPVQTITFETIPEVLAKAESNMKVPEWLVEEWRDIHKIEPLLFPDKWLVENIVFYHVPESTLYRDYLELCSMFGGGASHVFLIPWLVKGGADLVTLNYVRALADEIPPNEIAVIATLNADSPWKERLPEGVQFVPFGQRFSKLATDRQELLLTRLLLQTAPKTVHNIQSELGFRMFVKYGAALTEQSKLFACSFCIDVTEDGRELGYPVMYLPECVDFLKAILSDNQTHLDDLVNRFAFDRNKLIVNYQPSPEITRTRNPNRFDIPENGELKILWAGRLDRQKRPDILVRIAEKCRELPFSFHVYGSPVLDGDKHLKKLSKLENLKYCGPFNGLPTLPVDDYDLFLYTSQWDGVPNILIEAATMGLPIVASNVGGISELIIHEKTGFLIDPFDNVDAYVSRLKHISENRQTLQQIAQGALELVKSRHSMKSFRENVKRIPYYIDIQN